MNLIEGTYLTKLARQAVTEFILNNKVIEDNNFKENQGVFVTIQTYPGKELRGCIGFPENSTTLSEATIKAAIAVTEDPRFPKLKKGELDHIFFVVSILTQPKEIKVNNPEEYKDHIEITKDGLIAELSPYRGLLLPHVFNKETTPEEAIEMTCQKAGLIKEHINSENFKLYKFQSEIFYESAPSGEIKQK